MTEDMIKQMANRFLAWKLPEDFHPDAGIRFDPMYNVGTEFAAKHEPTGTNLFTLAQAEVMVRHMVDGFVPAPDARPDYQTILAAFIRALSTADHLGDVQEAVHKAAQLARFLPHDYDGEGDAIYAAIEAETTPPSLWGMKP